VTASPSKLARLAALFPDLAGSAWAKEERSWRSYDWPQLRCALCR
jgi:hypothetical protein